MSATKRDAVLAALQNIVGPRHVLTDPALFAGALVEPRGLYHGKALALVRPGATKEVAAVSPSATRRGSASCRRAATPGSSAARRRT